MGFAFEKVVVLWCTIIIVYVVELTLYSSYIVMVDWCGYHSCHSQLTVFIRLFV